MTEFMMKDEKVNWFYRGKNIEEMTVDELRDALRYYIYETLLYQEQHRREIEALQAIRRQYT